MKFFGREPAQWIGLLETVLMLATVFVAGFSQETAEVIIVIVSASAAIVTALLVRPVQNAVITGSAKTLLVAAIALGLPLTADQVATITAFIAFLLAFITRHQVSPLRSIDVGRYPRHRGE